MSAVPTMESLRCTINEDLFVWLSALSARLYLNNAVVIRMFVLQLKEEEPATLAKLEQFMAIGLCEAVVQPKMIKIYLDTELVTWLNRFARTLQHPRYPKRAIRPRHLVGGYLRYLQRNEAQCVRYGSIRLHEDPGAIHV